MQSTQSLSSEGTNTLSAGVDKLLNDLNVVAEDTRALAIKATGLSTRRMVATPDDWERKFGLVQEKLHQIATVIEKHSRQTTNAAIGYASTNPWKTIGLLSVAGVALGYLIFGLRHNENVGRTREKV